MGFMPAIKRFIKHLPQKRQNLLFSATMPKEIRHLADSILKDPVQVQINHSKPTSLVSHKLFRVEKKGKVALLKKVMKETNISSALVFTRTKYAAKKLAINLGKEGHRAVALQGNMSQNKRKEAMDGFRSGKFNVLVATDIAARGIDVSGISHVINYDVPATVEAYTHRIGRTGRADQTGEAFTFATGEDTQIIRAIERVLDKQMTRQDTGKLEMGQDISQRTPSDDNRWGKRPARSAAKRQSSDANSGQRRSSGNKVQNGSGGRPAQNAASPKAGKVRQRRRRRSAPLGVDFFTTPKRSDAKSGRKAA
jgi:ATP-dependent RNA helicase RhlE